MMKPTHIFIKLALGFALLGSLLACGIGEKELAFETVVDRSIGYSRHSDKDLFVATNPDEARQIVQVLEPSYVLSNLEEHLVAVDYTQYWVVAAYLGSTPYTGADIQIERVTQITDTVNVMILAVEPKLGDKEMFYPIHAVKIRKADLSTTGLLHFNVWREGQIILTREHTLP